MFSLGDSFRRDRNRRNVVMGVAPIVKYYRRVLSDREQSLRCVEVFSDSSLMTFNMILCMLCQINAI